MNLFRWKALSRKDPSFRGLFEVLPSRLRQEEVGKLLRGYKYINEGPKSEFGFAQEQYYESNTLPTPSIRIMSDEGVPICTNIRIGYPSKIVGISMSFSRNLYFITTSNIMKNLFGKLRVENGVPFYQKDEFVAIVSKSDAHGKVSVIIDMLDTLKIPFDEKIKMDYRNKTGFFINRI